MSRFPRRPNNMLFIMCTLNTYVAYNIVLPALQSSTFLCLVTNRIGIVLETIEEYIGTVNKNK